MARVKEEYKGIRGSARDGVSWLDHLPEPIRDLVIAIESNTDQEATKALLKIDDLPNAASAAIQFIDLINRVSPAPDLTKSNILPFIRAASSNNFSREEAEMKHKEKEEKKLKRINPDKEEEKDLPMAAESKKQRLKEVIKKHILKRLNEQEDETGEKLELSDNVRAARKALFSTPDEKIIQALRNVISLEEAAQLYVSLLDFINAKSPAPDLDPDIAIKYLSGAEDREEVSAMEPEVDIDAEAEEETVDEMSTTAGAPAPATKYAFRRKKK